jgi:hypothetical protein
MYGSIFTGDRWHRRKPELLLSHRDWLFYGMEVYYRVERVESMYLYASALTQRPSPAVVNGSAGNDTLDGPPAEHPAMHAAKYVQRIEVTD